MGFTSAGCAAESTERRSTTCAGVQRTSVSRLAESRDDAHVALRGRKLQEGVGT